MNVKIAAVDNKRKQLYKYVLPALIISFLMVFTACKFISYSRIENVIDRIRLNGGAVQAKSVIPVWAQNFSPTWLQKKFQKPYAVWLPPDFGDEEVKQILEIKDLTSLTATGTEMTDKSFIILVDYKGLKLLYLSRNKFTLEQLKWLEKKMPATTIIY